MEEKLTYLVGFFHRELIQNKYMDKQQLLQILSEKVKSGEVSKAEVLNLVGSRQVAESTEISKKIFTLNRVFYIFGGLLVTVGIVFFMILIWDDVNSFTRILVTLVLGVVFAVIGSTLMLKKKDEIIGPIFHTIGGVLVLVGVLVTLEELNSAPVPIWYATISFAFLFVCYLLLDFFHKHPILSFFAIVHGTIFVYLLLGAFLKDFGNLSYIDDLFAYLTMLIGISYLALGHTFQGGRNNRLVGLIFFFGITGLLGAMFSRVFDSSLWEVLFFAVIIGSFFLSVKLKSTVVLIMSAVFFIIHSSYITFEHFANSGLWPFLIIFLGFLFIGIGYVSVSISKKYISAQII